MNLLWLTACFDAFDPGWTPWIPDLSVSTQLPTTTGASVQRAEKYLLPSYIADWDTDVQRRCAEGEDMRAHFSTQWAMVEIQRWGVLLNGMYTTSLNDGVLDPSGHRGLLLPLLYDQLLNMRLTAEVTQASLPCWSEFEGRLLVVAEPATDWSLLRRVVYTAHQAGFEHVDLLVADPQAVADAQADPPYPAFDGARAVEEESFPPRLNPSEVERARAMLEAGQRIRDAGAACTDRLSVHMDEDGVESLRGEPRHGGALDPEEPDNPYSIDPFGSLEIVLSAHGDTEYAEVIERLESLRRLHPGAGLAFDGSTVDTPSYAPIGLVQSSSWTSYTKETWLPVIELDPEQLGQPLSCVAPDGTVHER